MEADGEGTFVEQLDEGQAPENLAGELLALFGVAPSGGAPGTVTVTFTADGRVCLVLVSDDGDRTVRCTSEPAFSQAGERTLTMPVDEPGLLAVLQVDEGALRISSSDRIGTAVEASRSGWDTSEVALLASAATFPDALAASSLAGMLDAPLLLTRPDALDTRVLEELVRLGATRVVVLGGTAAIEDAVVDELTGAGMTVERLAGPDRASTAEAIAAAAGGAHHGLAFVASGDAFPDALAAGPVAATGVPIYLTAGGRLTESTLAAMTAAGTNAAVILGGTDAVATEVEEQITAAGIDVGQRLAGGTRYETALAVLDYAVLSGYDLTELVVATGTDFPDALAAGAYGARTERPILLIDGQQPTAGQPAAAYLAANADAVELLVLLGGAAAVTEPVRQELQALL